MRRGAAKKRKTEKELAREIFTLAIAACHRFDDGAHREGQEKPCRGCLVYTARRNGILASVTVARNEACECDSLGGGRCLRCVIVKGIEAL
jgi:hypothetical protein